MAHSFRIKRSSGLIYGSVLGIVAGVVFSIDSWLLAATIKVLLTWDTGIWPDWFPGYIPDFILSRWWVIIFVTIFTLTGAIVGSIQPRKFEIF